MSRTNPQQFCEECHKPLERFPCGKCDGKGYEKGTGARCTDCEGKGWVMRCPDDFHYIMNKIKNLSKIGSKPVPTLRKPTLKNPANPQVPPSWHPSNPNYFFNPNNPNGPLNRNNPNSPLHRRHNIHKGPNKK